MLDRLERFGHLLFGEELLHHQKFREMIVAAILQIGALALAVDCGSPMSISEPVCRYAEARDQAILGPVVARST